MKFEHPFSAKGIDQTIRRGGVYVVKPDLHLGVAKVPSAMEGNVPVEANGRHEMVKRHS